VQRVVEVAVPGLQGGTAVLRADPGEPALGGLQLDACRPIVPGRHRRGGGVEPAGDLFGRVDRCRAVRVQDDRDRPECVVRVGGSGPDAGREDGRDERRGTEDQ
jgi:hypothetical protein